MNILSITGMQFHSYHGCNDEEQKIGNTYTVDVYFSADMNNAMLSDDLNDAIDYVEIYNITEKEMKIPSKLIEHICNRILQKIVTTFPQITYCKVMLTKHQPPIAGLVEKVSIQMEYKNIGQI